MAVESSAGFSIHVDSPPEKMAVESSAGFSIHVDSPPEKVNLSNHFAEAPESPSASYDDDDGDTATFSQIGDLIGGTGSNEERSSDVSKF